MDVLGMGIGQAFWIWKSRKLLGYLDILSRTDIPRDIMVSCIEVQCGYETKENETSGSFRWREKKDTIIPFNKEHIYSSLLRHSSPCT
jgi:hypothetical protein